MKKSVVLMMLLALLFAVCATSCGEKKPVDKKALVKELIEKGEYQQAQAELVILRGQYPTDPDLIAFNKLADEKLAEISYQKYWDEAAEANTFKSWVEAMIKIKKVENINKEMVNGWIKRAAEKCVDASAKEFDDAKLLGALEKLVQRYQVITPNDRLMYITMFVKEGRFPLHEKDEEGGTWEDYFTKKFPELMDDETGKFVGWPRPEKGEKK